MPAAMREDKEKCMVLGVFKNQIEIAVLSFSEYRAKVEGRWLYVVSLACIYTFEFKAKMTMLAVESHDEHRS